MRMWLSSIVNAVRSRNGQALHELVDWNDSVANAPVQSDEELEREAFNCFRSLQDSHTDNWKSFAVHHLRALSADRNGNVEVR